MGASASAAMARARRLGRTRAPAEAITPAGRVERRVSEKPPATDLQEDRGPSDVRDRERGHASLGTPACSSAHWRA